MPFLLASRWSFACWISVAFPLGASGCSVGEAAPAKRHAFRGFCVCYGPSRELASFLPPNRLHKKRPTSLVGGSRLRHWLDPPLSSAHPIPGGRQSLYQRGAEARFF